MKLNRRSNQFVVYDKKKKKGGPFCRPQGEGESEKRVRRA